MAACGSASAKTIKVPGDYQTIQAAVDNAVNGDTVLVSPGTYKENIEIKSSGVTLRGEETARTFLQSPKADAAIVTIDGLADVNIRNFTFIGFAIEMTAVNVSQSSNVAITNNVFDIGPYATAVDISGEQSIDVTNNTFYANKIAIDRSGTTANISNNIFAKNDTAITGTSDSNVSSNCFYKNGGAGTVIGSDAITEKDPLFVDSEVRDYQLRDFHLRKGSPCIGKGAWSGDYADSKILPVNNVILTAVTDSYSIDVAWDENPSYKVNGYKVYYDSDQSGPPYDGDDAAGGNSPIDTDSETSYRLENLSPRVIRPAAPSISSIEENYRRLTVSWSAVDDATEYKIYYGINDVTENEVSTGNVTSYTLDGLKNGVTYKVAVSALARTIYYVAVTAYENADNESGYSQEASIAIGEGFESERSTEKTGIPETVIPYPNLPDEGGCFIASAAYGSYGAAEVRILRDFRDNYLITNRVGRDFVHFYYTYSPFIASFISEYALLRHAVKQMLTPIVAVSLVLSNVKEWFEYPGAARQAETGQE